MSAIKRVIRQFYRLVHPDLMSNSPPEALNCNSKSLQELNAYIDRLESRDYTNAPFVSRSIQFFKPLLNRSGKPIYGTLRACHINLASISPSADMLEKEDLSVQLIHEIESAMQSEKMFSNRSAQGVVIEPIIRSAASSQSSVRNELQKIWDDEALSNRIKDSIFSSVDDRLSQYKEYQSIQIHNKLLRKYSRIKNPKRRNKRLESIPDEVEESLRKKELASSLDVLDVREADPTAEIKVRIIESGFHPDLVFFDPSLTPEEKEIGISRICGVNLVEEPDLWLLENIWRTVRRDQPPPVPVVLSRQYRGILEGGFLEIPFEFELDALVEFLEINLESVRDARRTLLDSNVAI